MSTEDWDDYPVSGLFDREDYPIRDDWDETSGAAIACADSAEDWCDSACDYDADDGCIDLCGTYRQPTVWEILTRQGIRAAINYKCERMCVAAFAAEHADAKQHGYNLTRPGYQQPWWFTWVSKLEWLTRPKKK